MRRDPNTATPFSDQFNDKASKLRKLYLDRLETTKAYGIPVRIISARDIEAHAPRDLDRKTLWKRMFNELSSLEQSIFTSAARFYYDNDTPIRAVMNPRGGPYGYQWAKDQYHIIRYYADNCVNGDGRQSGNQVSIRRRTLRSPSNAWEAGPKRYIEAHKGVIIMNDLAAATQIIAGLTLHTHAGNLQELHIHNDAMHLLSLEHELAHLAGADEPQADAMGAAQYIRHTGDVRLPRIYADMRALGALRNIVEDIRLREARDNNTLEEHFPYFAKHPHQIDSYLDMGRRYLWGCVDALDHLLRKPMAEIRRISDEDIHAMRFKAWDQKHDQLETIGKAILHLAHKDGETNLDDTTILASYLPKIQKNLAGTDARPIIARLIRASNNLICQKDDTPAILLARPNLRR